MISAWCFLAQLKLCQAIAIVIYIYIYPGFGCSISYLLKKHTYFSFLIRLTNIVSAGSLKKSKVYLLKSKKLASECTIKIQFVLFYSNVYCFQLKKREREREGGTLISHSNRLVIWFNLVRIQRYFFKWVNLKKTSHLFCFGFIRFAYMFFIN